MSRKYHVDISKKYHNDNVEYEDQRFIVLEANNSFHAAEIAHEKFPGWQVKSIRYFDTPGTQVFTEDDYQDMAEQKRRRNESFE